MKRKIAFIGRLLWSKNKILLLASVVKIPIWVVLSYLSLYLTKILVEGIESRGTLPRYIAGIAGVFLLKFLLSVIKDWAETTAGWGNTLWINSLLKAVDQKTMCTDYSNVEGMEGQKIRQKALDAVYTAGQGLMQHIVSFCVNLAGLILYGVTMGTYHMGVLCMVTVTAFGGYMLTGQHHRYEKKQKAAVADCNKKMNYLESEAVSLQAAREIRLYDMSGLLDQLYGKQLEERLRLEDRIFRVKVLIGGCSSLLSFLRDFTAYFYFMQEVLAGRMTVAEFVLMIGLVSGMSGWLGGVLKEFGELRKAEIYLEDYFRYLDLDDRGGGNLGSDEAWTAERRAAGKGRQDIEAPGIERQPVKKAPKMEFQHVGFRYEGAEEDALTDINLTVMPGEKLAIVGKNGAGKTTLVKLLAGLYRPDSGRILVDGQDIAGYGREEYFRAISAVFQDIMLLPVGVLQNVSSHVAGKTDETKVMQCLEMAEIDSRIRELPQGMNTPMLKSVRSDGVDLSGGEQQKVILAKALYKDAGILLLDEPTAALDPVSENNIYQKYGCLAHGLTSFFISHRLASTNFCDRIILMDRGRILEQGSHRELMERRGEYWKMFTTQSRYYQERG